MAIRRNVGLVLLSVLISGVCLHTRAATLRRAPSQDLQGGQRWKHLFLCAEEERECEHTLSSNFTEEFSQCSVMERRYCVPHDKTVDCCMNISAPSVIEVCSHLTKNSARMIVSCRQFRRELSTASTVPHSHGQSLLHVILPTGASSAQIYGLGQSPNLTKIYVEANRSQNVFFNNTVLTHKGVQMHFKSSRTEGWYRILVHQRTTEAIGVTFEAVSSVIYYYSIPTLEAISGGSGSSFEPNGPESWICLIKSYFRWEYGQFGQCSTTCGSGKKYKRAICVDYSSGSEVADFYCGCHDPPPVIEQSCGTKPCKPSWFTGKWSNCSQSCGQGYEQREVLCVRVISEDSFEILHANHCNTQDEPSPWQSCEGHLCFFIWVSTAWRRCSSPCGPGTQARDVRCHMLNGTVVSDSACAGQVKPTTRQACNLNPQCYFEWGEPSDWGECHGNCRVSTRGRKYRTVRCVAKDSNGNILSDAVSEKFCEADRKPIESVPCELSCNLGQWHAIVIQECNGTCGTDVYVVKMLVCHNKEGNLISSRLCPRRASTYISERCDVPFCAPPANCTDATFANCPKLVGNTPCDDYYTSLCCKTCYLLNG